MVDLYTFRPNFFFPQSRFVSIKRNKNFTGGLELSHPLFYDLLIFSHPVTTKPIVPHFISSSKTPN